MSRSTPSDGHRIYQLYYYLCACLAMEHRADGSPISAAISDRLTNKSDFRKLVSKIFQPGASETETIDLGSFSRLTTGELVTMLARLRESLRRDYQKHEKNYTQVLSTGDILTVLAKLVELTPEEREALDLDIPGDGLTLLQRALLILQTMGALENYEMIFRLYKAAIGLEFFTADPSLQNLEQVDELIEETVRKALDYLPDRPSQTQNHGSLPGSEDTIRELTRKAQREVRRLLARSGNQEGFSIGRAGVDSYIQHYFQPRFVVKLAQTVVANERLTHPFPVYLKYVSSQPAGPLPFADKAFESRDQLWLNDTGPYPALLHPSLRKVDQFDGLERTNQLPGPGDYELASQEANRVVAEFYIKVPENYQPAVPRIFQKISSEAEDRIDFSLSSTGVGGALSHLIKVINTALLRDLPCLVDYFSIAHDVTSTQTIVRDNVASPIWAHSLVKLCRKTIVGQAIQVSGANGFQPYERFSFGDPLGHGDYCGFDFFTAQAHAAFQARLQAIRNTGVVPTAYVRDLCRQVEYRLALQEAWANLQGYPFSSLAMIGVIEREILPQVGTQDDLEEGETGCQRQDGQGDRPLAPSDPYIFFDAYLSIAEALLDEGTYRRACHYLNRLKALDEFVQRETAYTSEPPVTSGVEIFSGGLLVRYLLCWANYYYLYDPEDQDPDYLPPNCTPDINREGLVRRAWQVLEQARQLIERRLRKYVVINEVSQGTFHPHYHLLARMTFLRAKLLLFFSRYVPAEKSYLATDMMVGQQRTHPSIHWGRLYLGEKARLYAAADGNGELYACYAAMQCWMYLITAYADPKCFTLMLSYSRFPFSLYSRTDLVNWARTLRNHALISYAETGRQCYYQIKEKSGLPNESDPFGAYRIQKIKPIYESRGPQDMQLGGSDSQILVLDLSLLCIDPRQIPKLSPNHPDRTIYLFGTNACYLFFARGMFLLCSDQASEFDATPVQDLAQWDEKLTQATRLLNMAWAIAEEGGHIERAPTGGDTEYTITRDEGRAIASQDYTPVEVNSIRDLYPRRVTEIADLGKVFSAACMVLRLYTVVDAARPPLVSDIDRILQALHGAHRLNDTLRGLMAQQHRYNGHLKPFFDRAKDILYRHREVARESLRPASLTSQRDTLLGELFDTLMQ